MLGNQLDQRRTHHHAIGDAGDVGGLFGGAHAETDGDGQVGVGFQAGDGFFDAGLAPPVACR